MSTGKLQITTPTDREIAMTRVFDAPRALVFDAMTKPDLVKRWLSGPPGWTMTMCTIDLRPGGHYRYEWQKEGGASMGMGGEYREVIAPERVVQTEVFDEAWYPGEAVGTLVLIEHDGRTTATTTVRYNSKETRDAVLQSGMSYGVEASYANLDELLAADVAAAR